MLTQVIFALLGSLVLGALLVVLGLRGKRLNKHPVCRDCRFDLSAQPQGVITCPECGAGLKRPKAIRIGQRRRRPVFLGVGSLAVILPLFSFGFAGFAAATGSSLDKHKPLGLLLWERAHGGASRSQPIAAEVLARYQGGKLAPDQEQRVISEALHVQADPKATWAVEWGDLLEQAKTDGKLSAPQQGLANAQAAVLEFKLRPRIAAGDPLPLYVRVKESRASSGATLNGTLTLKSAEIDGAKVTRARDGGEVSVSFGPGANMIAYFNIAGPKSRWGMSFGGQGGGGAVFKVPKDLAPGRHTFKLTGIAKIEPMSMTGGYNPFQSPKKDDPNARPVTYEGAFDLLAQGESSVAIATPDAATDANVTKQIQVVTQSPQFGGDMGWMQLNLETLKTPVAYDVYITVDGKEKRIAGFSSSKMSLSENAWFGGDEGTRNLTLQLPQGFKGGSTDLTLRPSAKLAARTVDQERIYGGTIVLKDVDLGKPRNDMGESIMSGIFQSLFR
jgi:hypothetical protein